LTIKNSGGSAATNVLLAPAVPSFFSLDYTGSGAAAINGVTGTIVSSTNPLHSGNFLTIFLTGLGVTTIQNGFEYAQTQPGITVGSQPCRVTFAGRAPTIPGVGQINCIIPDGVSGMALPVLATSSGRTSNTVNIAVQ
jgi:uncharacterized protein (TIGR03437 family)